MATKSKSTAKKNTAIDGIFSAFPAAFMANLSSTPMTGYTNWWQAYMTGATQMNKELMRFVATRLQHDAKLGESLTKCGDWADAANIHGDWVRTMSEEYMGEVETFMKIAAAIGEEGWTAANGGAGDTDVQASKSSD